MMAALRGPNQETSKPSEEFPALRQFFSGYLHQDFRSEYGSALQAAEAYCREASAEEIVAVNSDWQAWSAQLKGHPLDQIQNSIRKLGAAWAPQSVEDVDRIGELFALRSHS
jgi:uncharacterized protein YukE